MLVSKRSNFREKTSCGSYLYDLYKLYLLLSWMSLYFESPVYSLVFVAPPPSCRLSPEPCSSRSLLSCHPFCLMHASLTDAPSDLDCLTGDEKTDEHMDEDMQTYSQEDNWNQNHSDDDPVGNGHYLALVPGNRRPIDPTVAAHFANMAPRSPLIEVAGGEQLKRLEQHQEKLKEMQHRQEQERQKRQWLEEERLRLEQQKQLEKQRRELLQLQLQQQQQEHRHRRQVLQWQLELEQQYRMQQKHIQQQQQLRRSPTGVMLSPSSGLCTIYEAMETSDEEDGEHNRKRQPAAQGVAQDFQMQLRPVPPQDLEWNRKVDMVQQLINQTLMLSGDRGCPPLLLLPVGTGGTLSPLESSMWPDLQLSPPPAATVTSVSSFSPDSRGSSPPGDWTVVEVETQH
ncbi:hypothetical protein PBY51_008305 [Eleginops maclovinus]|uniref:BTB/POZ domain-containing protein n=1 Tax=Eleginops maclovinus TaxID=56733 RepID=A0AAN7XAR7_ELEMC|nr:hypothetical protein PBY51_008305 [Eleginops maclovinus]